VTQGLQALGHPLALGRRLDHDVGARSRPEYLGELSRLRVDPALDQFPLLAQDANLAVLLVDVDANMVHGWPLHSLLRRRPRAVVGRRLYATTFSEGSAASSHLRSRALRTHLFAVPVDDAEFQCGQGDPLGRVPLALPLRSALVSGQITAWTSIWEIGGSEDLEGACSS
jgi:hypothetical protein